ncbi:mastermind-like protein 3 [Limulus polyphemus]|uniref:Mastermind-like protein 3 n=1 Tax=Limulus polyphemus TaxID=6850 RepID=A0ABM1BXS4_LIMPO|nr:mastermind-like protein 3 [Limulus polyphemus]
MGDILPPKRQAVVDRLRRRIELYRRKQNGSLIRYEQTSNGWNHQQRQDTIFLKQRYLETKAKKAKKNDNKSTKDGLGTNSENARNVLSKPAKRPAESLDTPLNQSDGLGDPPERQVKLACRSSSPSQGQRETQGQSSLPRFSVQIVQQFSSSDSSHVQNSQTIQTNVTVKAVHPESPMTSMASGQCNTLQEPQVSSATSIECKQEKVGNLNQCSSMGLSTCNNHNSTIGNNSGVGERFSDAFSTLGFPDDSSGDVIDPDILKDLIDDVLTTGNPSDLMKDFNFDDSDREQDQEPKETVDPMLDITGKSHSTPPLHGHFSSTHSPFSTMQAQGGTSGFSPGPRGSPMGNHTSVSVTPSTTYQSPHSSNYTHSGSFSVSPTLGLDFKLSEPSPAAQTLKQMAEQHQSLQQKQQIGLNMSSPHSRSPFTNENFTESMTLPPIRSGFMSASSGQVNTAQKTQASSMLAARSYDKQVNFTSVRPASGSGPFKQETENGVFPGSQGITTTNNMAPVPGMEYQKQQQVMQMQHLHQLPPEQKSVMSGSHYGVPSPDNKQSQSGMPQPSAYGSTRPLSHFTAGQTSSVHNQFVRGPSPGVVSSPTQHYRPSSRSNLQLSQTQQLQISQTGSQLQVCQSQQLQMSRDFKQNPTGNSQQQQQISVFSTYPHSTTAPRPPFQMNMSQTQSVNFTNQFSGTGNSNGVPAHEEMCQHMMKQHVVQQNNIGATASQREIQLQQFLNRPPPEYKHHTVTNQVLPPHQQMMADNSMVVLNPTQTSQRFSQPSDVSRRGLVSESTVHTLQHPSSQNQMSVRARTQQACVPTPHVGMGSALSNLNQTTGSSTHPNITSANLAGHMSRTRSVYSSCLPRSQRPPNVNVGPEGLNISQRAVAPEWRQLLLQQQQQQSGVRPISQPSSRMQFSRAPLGTMGQNMLSPTMNMLNHQIIPRTVVPQQAMRGETTQRQHLQNNQILMHPHQQMTFHTGMDPMDSTNGQPNTMLMTTLASSTTNLTNQRNIYPTNDSTNQSNQVDDPTHFNLDFLDNNFIEGTDSDLLNIDPVLNGGNSSFSLLDEMNMLNK